MDLDTILEDVTDRDWQTKSGGSLRVAIVGLGWFGADVGLTALSNGSNCEPTVVVGDTIGKAASIADEADITHALTYDDYHEGAESDMYDAVYIATPNATHLEYTQTAADLGKHVICEKPLEATAARAEQMVQSCESAGVTLMTAYRMQFTPVVRRMRELIRAGSIGEPVRVEGVYAAQLLDKGGDPDQWRLDPELAGGGSLIDIGIYPINTGLFVLDAEPTAISAHTVSVHEDFDGVDEHATFRLEFDGGMVLTGHSSYNEHNESYLRVSGTDGKIMLNPGFGPQLQRRLTIEHDDTTVTFSDSVDEMVEEFEYFSQCVLNDDNPEPDGRSGLRDLRIVEAIYESATSRSTVSFSI